MFFFFDIYIYIYLNRFFFPSVIYRKKKKSSNKKKWVRARVCVGCLLYDAHTSVYVSVCAIGSFLSFSLRADYHHTIIIIYIRI